MKGVKTYIAPLLEAAKARLTPETWGQAARGSMSVPEGKVCVMTALSPCARLEMFVARDLLYRAIFNREPDNSPVGTAGDDLAGWNDRNGRTLADVHAAYDKAIALEHAQR